MGIMRRAAVAVGMLGLVARVGAAQALPVPATHKAPSIETMYKQLGLVAHAAKGQTLDQQKIDGRECYEAAKSQTGFDPLVAKSLNATAVAAQAASAAASKPSQQVNTFKKAAGSCLQARGYTLK
jgi:hypothetical protein